MTLELRPIFQRAAFEFVRLHHRHHDVPVGAVECLAAHNDDGQLVGVSIVGRPVSRALDDGLTFEVTRLCTLGDINCCSLLYGASRRYILDIKGGRRGLTYILEDEDGLSLKAAGWRKLWTTKGGSWDTPARRRTTTAPTCPKHAYGVGAWPALAV